MGRSRAAQLSAAAAAAALAVTGVLVWLPRASDAESRVLHQAWARTTAGITPLAPEPGRIYVSSAIGQDQAHAFVRVATDGGRGAADAVVVLRETPGAEVDDDVTLLVCPLVEPLAANGDISGAAPAHDCTTSTEPARGADGTWSVALGAVGGGENGIAIVPGETDDQAATFTVEFDATATRLADRPPPTTPSSTGNEQGGDPNPPSGEGSVPAAEDPPATVGVPSFGFPAADGGNTGEVVLDPVRSDPPDTGASPVGRAAARSAAVHAASPPAAVLLVPLLLAYALVWWRGPRRPTEMPMAVPLSARAAWSAGGALALVALLLFTSELSVFKAGFVGIVFIAAIGLHLLVNWTGELSLAHAGFVGLPAFLVAQVSSHTGVSPLLLLPVGIAAGAALGAVVAAPAMRAKGLQVALVTLAVGIAIDRFFFVRSWIIGPPGGLRIPAPSLLGVHFETNRSLFPVLVAITVFAAVAAHALLHSKHGRAFSYVRFNPDAAAVAGVPVALYRRMAYVVAGSFAGLAGATYVVWVQRVTPQAFPVSLSFTYLVIAVLAGRGGLAGVAISAAILEGGRLFEFLPGDLALYLGPLALIYNVTQFPGGFNAALREIAHRHGRPHQPSTGSSLVQESRTRRPPVSPLVLGGTLAIVAGFGAIALAWYHMGNTDQLWVQNQEIVSGGIGGLGLILLGATLLIRDALLHGRTSASVSPEASLSMEHADRHAPNGAGDGPSRRRHRRTATATTTSEAS